MLLSVHVTSVLFLVWLVFLAQLQVSIGVTRSYFSRPFLCAVVIFIDILLCIKWSYCIQWYTYVLESPLVLHLSEHFNYLSYLNTLQSNVFG